MVKNLNAKQNFKIVKVDLKSNSEEIFDNDGAGYFYDSGVKYIEVGPEPFSIRYADYGKMFKGMMTVILQYSESPFRFYIKTMDEKLKSNSIVLSGLIDYQEIGVFNIYQR